MIENLIEFLRNRGGLTIAAGKRKRPKSLENQGLWAMVPVTGLEYTMEHPAETPGGNSPPDCCIYMGSSPSPLDTKKRTPGRGSLFLVPVTGLEPVRCRQRWILSPEKYLEARCNRRKLIETCNRKKHLQINDYFHSFQKFSSRSPPPVVHEKTQLIEI